MKLVSYIRQYSIETDTIQYTIWKCIIEENFMFSLQQVNDTSVRLIQVHQCEISGKNLKKHVESLTISKVHQEVHK